MRYQCWRGYARYVSAQFVKDLKEIPGRREVDNSTNLQLLGSDVGVRTRPVSGDTTVSSLTGRTGRRLPSQPTAIGIRDGAFERVLYSVCRRTAHWRLRHSCTCAVPGDLSIRVLMYVVGRCYERVQLRAYITCCVSRAIMTANQLWGSAHECHTPSTNTTYNWQRVLFY